MIKRHERLRRILIYSTAVLVTAAAIIVGISYQVLGKLTFAGDRIIYGKKLSDLVQDIRVEMVKNPDLSPISFKSTGGLTLAGYMITRKNAKANAVFCHGYRSTKELMYAMLDIFPDWNILLFDFRAHGMSDGNVTSIGYNEYEDVITAAQTMRKIAQENKTQQLPFILLGISMGGAASLKAVEHQPNLCDALIIDSTYARLSNTIFKAFSTKAHLPLYPFFPVIKYLFQYFAACDIHMMNPEDSVLKIKQPILFIHSVRDSYISSANALRLYAGVQNQNSKLWIAPECRHGWLHSYFPEAYRHKCLHFLNHAGVLK